MSVPSLWKFENYQDFMKAYVKSLPHNGRGFSTRIAEALRIHPTLLSQILQGHRDLTLEQASLFCDYVNLPESECDLFLKFVEFGRAGNESLKKRLRRQIDLIVKEHHQVRAQFSASAQELSEEEKSIFYSSWHYSAFRMLCSLEKKMSSAAIANELKITRERAEDIENFLLKTGLIVEEDGVLRMGPSTTFVPADSHWSTRHHLNWRTKNLNRIEHVTTEELCFTAPLSCSAEDFKKIKESVLELIKGTRTTVSKTTPENVYTLCIDLLKL